MKNKGLWVIGAMLLFLSVMAPIRIHQVQTHLAEEAALLRDLPWEVPLGQYDMGKIGEELPGDVDGQTGWKTEKKAEIAELEAADLVPDGERIAGYEDGYWIMEWEMPWSSGRTLTMNYLRDEDFQVALGGTLFEGIQFGESGDGLFMGCAVVSGTYDAPPQNEIAVDDQVLAKDGTVVYSAGAEQNKYAEEGVDAHIIVTSYGEGLFCTEETIGKEDPVRKLYFLKDLKKKTEGILEGLILDGDIYPEGIYPNGLVCFRKLEGKSLFEKFSMQHDIFIHRDPHGFMDEEGNILVPAIFEDVSTGPDGCAAVVYHDQAGVVDLEKIKEEGVSG